jgi:hypothetical protein
MPRIHEKTPDENLDYAIDHSGELPDADTIIDSAWDVPDGLTGSGESVSGQSAIIFLTGGVVGSDYTVTNVSTTDNGRVVEDYIVIQVR